MMAEEWQIEGKHFLVTGGASGLGAGNVQELLDKGAKFVAILDINEEAGKSFTDYCNQMYSGKVMFVKCDVGNDDSLTRSFNQVLAKLKRIDAVINNAGILNDSLDQWPSSVDVNVKGLISLTWKGVTHMRKDKGGAGGVIINVSSVATFMDVPGVPVYSATKSAVLHFGKCLSCGDFYKNTGVRVMTICYGATNTAMYRSITNSTYDEGIWNNLQNIDSAVKCIIPILENGKSGSVWLSHNGEAVKDITAVVESAFDHICKTLNL